MGLGRAPRNWRIFLILPFSVRAGFLELGMNSDGLLGEGIFPLVWNSHSLKSLSILFEHRAKSHLNKIWFSTSPLLYAENFHLWVQQKFGMYFEGVRGFTTGRVHKFRVHFQKFAENVLKPWNFLRNFLWRRICKEILFLWRDLDEIMIFLYKRAVDRSKDQDMNAWIIWNFAKNQKDRWFFIKSFYNSWK